jgi:hypothetical protein
MSEKKKKRGNPANMAAIREAFDPDTLAAVCELPEEYFGECYDLEATMVPQNAPYDFYFYSDRGADILFVAHLDTVAKASTRTAHFVDTAAGMVVFSRALDDRLGAYIGLELLPKLGITLDVLLTTGEEVGQSTAQYFATEKKYNWVIEFDRGGTDVVMYQYEDFKTRELVRECGAVVGNGIFSDISHMDTLGIKCFNWGTGYMDYHYARSHAYLNDTFKMVDQFLSFYALNKDTRLPHEDKGYSRWGGHGYGSSYHYGGSRSGKTTYSYPGGWAQESGTGAMSPRKDWWDEVEDQREAKSGLSLSKAERPDPGKALVVFNGEEGVYEVTDYELPTEPTDDELAAEEAAYLWALSEYDRGSVSPEILAALDSWQ